MSVYEFLAYLRSLDIQISAENGKLRINAPQGAVTPEIKSELAARKAEILSLLAETEPIRAAPPGEPLPLSLAQEQLWQLHRLTPDTVAYNMYAAFRLCGQLDIAALETAIQMVVERHKILRTSFPKSSRGEPEQVIEPSAAISLRRVTLPISSRARDELQSFLETEIRQPFDLASGPLFRPTLIRIDQDEHALLLVMHHIISDGHSFSILYEDLERAYRALHIGRDIDWPALPLGYADYAAWQRNWLSSAAGNSNRQFWQKQLAGDVPALELPLDHPYPAHPDADGDFVGLDFPQQLSADLRELCRRVGVTLFTTVLTAFNVLLHRHSGQRDLVVCTPVAARDRNELSRVVGYFNNTLLLRTDLSEASTYQELLQQTQSRVMDALAHQMFPFTEAADFPNLGRTPLSRAMVVVQNAAESLQWPNLEIREIPIFNHAVQYDLAVEMKNSLNQLTGRLMYRKSLFERDTAIKLAQEFMAILEDMVVHPDGLMRQDNPARPAAGQLEKVAARLPYTAPRTGLELRLAQIWQEVLQVEQIGIHDEFFELGGHSLLALRLFTRIEQETGTSLPLSTLFGTTTIASLALLIEAGDSGAVSECLVPIQPLGSKAPFFLIHGVEGGVLGYRDLADALGDDQPVLGLQLLLENEDGPSDQTIEEMAARYISVMCSQQPQGPYRIGGYCFGGVVAYEMARQLERRGEQVSLLAVFEGAMPDTQDSHVTLLRRLREVWKNIPTWIQDYSRMSPHQFLNRMRSTMTRVWSKLQPNSELKRRARVEETLDIAIDHLPSSHIELTDRCLKAALEYTPEIYNGTVTLFRARNRSFNEVVFGSLDPKMGWGPLAKGGVVVHLVEGYHRNMHLDPYVKSLANELKHYLE